MSLISRVSSPSRKRAIVWLALCCIAWWTSLSSTRRMHRSPVLLLAESAGTTSRSTTNTTHNVSGSSRLVGLTNVSSTTSARQNRTGDIPASQSLPAKDPRDEDPSQSTVGWSDSIVNSTEYFWGNNQSITFSTDLTMDTRVAQLSIRIAVNNSEHQCPYPSFRVRLTGVAVVHIPMGSAQHSDTSHIQHGIAKDTDAARQPESIHVFGSAWLPIPGQYFLEILLLHCSLDAYNASRTSDEIKHQCPLVPKIHRDVKDYTFTVHPFYRSNQVVNELEATSPTYFPRGAWIFAPTCPTSSHDVSAECTKASSDQPAMIRTKFQLKDYLKFMGLRFFRGPKYVSPEIISRFDHYVFLPVNQSDGTVDFAADHSVRTYVPPTAGLTNTSFSQDGKRLCFIGDSFTRYLNYEVTEILSNTTFGTDACENKKFHKWPPVQDQPNIRIELHFGHESESWSNSTRDLLSRCGIVYFTYSRWETSTQVDSPTTPRDYQTSVANALSIVEQLTPLTTNTYFLTNTAMALGRQILGCVDWRSPHMNDAYNDVLWKATKETMERPGLPVFRNLTRSFLVDFRDLSEPLWDSIEDWNHPCRHVFRPLARRLLELAAKDIVSGIGVGAATNIGDTRP